MKQYEKYKPSGIEWLGEIPEHWEVALLTKNLFTLVDYRGKTPRKLENDENIACGSHFSIVNRSDCDDFVICKAKSDRR